MRHMSRRLLYRINEYTAELSQTFRLNFASDIIDITGDMTEYIKDTGHLLVVDDELDIVTPIKLRI